VIEHTGDIPILIMLVGTLVVLSILTKSLFKRLCMPSLVGYMGLGFLLRLADVKFGFLSPGREELLSFLAKLGVIALLFRIGLESNLRGLLRQLRRGSFIWIGNVVFSGGLGYLFARLVLGLDLIPALFLGIALTATSVSISVATWEETGALRSPKGELLIDVAELDDISGIVLMAVLFGVVPTLKGGETLSLLPVLSGVVAPLLLKLLAFGTLCLLFSLYVERHITGFFKKIRTSPEPMLLVAGIGFIMAALAGLLGFSVAIGAFFAGLVFSRDPQSVKLDASFQAIYELFAPFFFIGIGLSILPGALTGAIGLGLLLLMVAMAGKFMGDGTTSWLTVGWTGALLISVSMIPRAEIAMVIMQRGLNLGEWAVPPDIFAAMVIVSAGTCIISPFLVRYLLGKWPQVEGGSDS
jgi:Kef-type K+ transport system membrane component KefB